MSKKFKPLLAATLEHDQIETINYPVAASPKLDGIRVIIKDGQVLTRSLKPLANKHVQLELGHSVLNGLDGEIIVGDPTDPHVFRNTTSAVRRADGEPDFKFYVFDNFEQSGAFGTRYHSANWTCWRHTHVPLEIVAHHLLSTPDEVRWYEEEMIEKGYEGIMLRDPCGEYKQGRSTLKEGILLKLKRFQHEEAEIIDVVERMHNANEATTNELGYTQRSTHKENKIGRGDLGALVVKCCKSGVQFNVGTGFTDEERAKLWAVRDTLPGQIIKYKFMGYGEYEAPRFPVYEGFRLKIDM